MPIGRGKRDWMLTPDEILDRRTKAGAMLHISRHAWEVIEHISVVRPDLNSISKVVEFLTQYYEENAYAKPRE